MRRSVVAAAVIVGCGPVGEEADDCPLDLGESASVDVHYSGEVFTQRYAWFGRRFDAGEPAGLWIVLTPSVAEMMRVIAWQWREEGGVGIHLDEDTLQTGSPIDPSLLSFAPNGFGFAVAGTVELDRIDSVPAALDPTNPPIVSGHLVADVMGEALAGDFTAYYCAALEDGPP